MNQQSVGSGVKPLLYIDCGWKSRLMLGLNVDLRHCIERRTVAVAEEMESCWI